MRIIAGIHRSRKLITLPGSSTRPMTDRMKETIFNIIGPYFDGGVSLDLFGGSGALTLEAISRGISHAFIFDINHLAINVIKENINSLKETDKVDVLQLDYKQALRRIKNLKFDLIFLDPPFRLNIINEIINFILENDMLKTKGIIVCQYIRGNLLPVKELTLLKQQISAINEFSIYQKQEE